MNKSAISSLILLLSTLSGAAVSFNSRLEKISSLHIYKNHTRIDWSVGSDDLQKRDAIYSQVGITIAPSQSFRFSFAPAVHTFYNATDMVLLNSYTAFDFGYSAITKRSLRPFVGFEYSFPVAIDGYTGISSEVDMRLSHNLFAPYTGFMVGDSSANTRFSVMIQPEIVTDSILPVNVKSALQVTLFPARHLSPSLQFVAQAPANARGLESLADNVAIGIFSSVRYRFSKHFDITMAFGISLNRDSTGEVVENYNGSIQLGMRTPGKDSRRRENRKQRAVMDSLTPPLFRDLNHGEFFPVRQDRDRDGVPDLYDSCDTQKELYNGRDDFDGCPEKNGVVDISIDTSMILTGVTFASGITELTKESKLSLAKILNPLLQDSLSTVTLKCFTDNTGDYERNMELALERFETVAAYLESQGIMRARIVPEIFGPNDPIADNESKNGRDTNRRIEYEIEFHNGNKSVKEGG